MPNFATASPLGSDIDPNELTISTKQLFMESENHSPDHRWSFDSVLTDEIGGITLADGGSSSGFDTTNKKVGSASLDGAGGALDFLIHATHLDNFRTDYTATGITFLFWYRPTDVTADQGLISKQNSATDNIQIKFDTAADKITAQLKVNNTNVLLTSTTVLTNGNFYLIGFAIGSDGDMTLTINGVNESEDLSTHSTIPADGTTTDLHIGANYNDTQPLKGQLDNLITYPSELTTAEILAIYEDAGANAEPSVQRAKTMRVY